MMRTVLLGFLVLSLSSCAGVIQGPPVNLEEVATPTLTKTPQTAKPVLPQSPSTPPGTIKAWVPPRQTAYGTMSEGHWKTLSLTEPLVETIEPAKTIPRAPHTAPPPKETKPQGATPLVPKAPPSQDAFSQQLLQSPAAQRLMQQPGMEHLRDLPAGTPGGQ